MKKTLFILLLPGLFACNRQTAKIKELENRVNQLEINQMNTYKPGFGEMMSSVQMHHAKLWFAGQNKNWKLADFEIHEMIEGLENIQKFQKDRPETQLIEMIDPSLDSIKQAIELQNFTYFNSSYKSLTQACNECHRATNFEFNVVKIPKLQSFGNQDFKAPEL